MSLISGSEPIKVIFRQFKSGDIIALFPEVAYNADVALCMSYQHTGQHGAVDISSVIRDTRPCNHEAYRLLWCELTRGGYTLKVVKRYTWQMQEKRWRSYASN